MQIVIDIDEDIYKARQHWVANSKRMVSEVDVAIANGIRLPKGHGRLIDADKLLVHKMYGIFGKAGYKTEAVYVDDINDAPTIIRADK